MDTLKTVERVIAIFNSFNLECTEMSGIEIADKASLPRGSIYRFLRVLERQGYLMHDSVTKKYKLGIKIFELGSLVWKDLNIRKLALPYMEELSKKCQETVHLGILDGNEVVSIEGAESGQSLRTSLLIGKRVCLHSTGIGKAILAFLPETHILEIIKEKGLPKFTENTITDLDILILELKSIRKNGFAVDNEENEIGIRCVAAPVLDNNKVVASISVSGPTIRIYNENIEKYAVMVKEICNIISVQLGKNSFSTFCDSARNEDIDFSQGT